MNKFISKSPPISYVLCFNERTEDKMIILATES